LIYNILQDLKDKNKENLKILQNSVSHLLQKIGKESRFYECVHTFGNTFLSTLQIIEEISVPFEFNDKNKVQSKDDDQKMTITPTNSPERIENQILVAIDFGNSNIRITVKHSNQYYMLKNINNIARFPQIVILNEQGQELGTEAEKNLIGNCNCYYKDFKLKVFKPNGLKDKHIKTNQLLINFILNYYKQMSRDYVKQHFEGKKIDKFYLTAQASSESQEKWMSVLISCCSDAGFNNIEIKLEEQAAINFYMKSYLKREDWSSKLFCVFNLGSICFYSTLWNYKEGSIQDISLNICQTEGGSCFDSKLQELFNRKLQNKIEKLLQPLIKPRKFNFDKLFNKKVFVENKKYLAECYTKYRQVLETFSGNSKSMQLQFRHIIDEQEIEISITKSEIEKELEIIINNLKEIIASTKKILNGESIHLIIIGNGFKFSGVKDLFKNEFENDFRQKGVFYDEEVVKGALMFD
jgi:molecular chaperone DnaK (HSP70)